MLEDEFVRVAPDRPISEKLIVYEGWLMKQGGIVPSWKRRLWRLDSWGLLSYFESTGKPPQGHINIADVTNIRVTAERSCELVTGQRIYYLYADTMEELLRFVRAVSLVKDKGASLTEADLVTLVEDEKVIHSLASSDASKANAKPTASSPPGPASMPLPPRPADYVPSHPPAAAPPAVAPPQPAPTAPVPPPPPPSISATFPTDWSGVKQRNMLIRTLQNWANYRLKLSGAVPVSDWTTEISNGVFLHTLLKALIPGVTVANFNAEPHRHIEKIQNLNAICVAIRAVHKSFPAVPVQDVVMGRANAALDLMWDIAYAFEIEDRVYDGKSGPAAVIAWAQESVKSREDVALSDLNSSFLDGLAFCAIVHRYEPSAIQLSSLQAHHRLENLQLAFNTAERCFQVPKLLAAQDFLDNSPDERSILLYLSVLSARLCQCN